MKGVGKGWAKGRTAAVDGRIARNAAAHRGRTYEHHLPPERDGRHRGGSARTLSLEWSETMAYVVGLMATDGSLSKDRRHLSFDSGDAELVQTFLTCLGRPVVIGTKRTKDGSISYRGQFSDVRLYRWLRSVGLQPRKSLTIGPIDVPDGFVAPLARGLLDGDGSIRNFVHAPTRSKNPDYMYERLWVYFTCASRPHLEWLKGALERTLGICGYIEDRPPTEARNAFFRLKFGKSDSVTLLKAMYPSADVPRLERKWRIWLDYATRHALI